MSSKYSLTVKDLAVSINGSSIIKEISFELEEGKILLILGKNGAGKSTLLKALMGSETTPHEGQILLNGADISKMSIDERARSGLFVGQQHPIEIPGVHMAEFLRISHNLLHPDNKYDPWSFNDIFESYARKVGLPSNISDRSINENFSGGEKKKAELLQLLLLKPKYAFLDEIDSGLDVSSLKDTFKIISDVRKELNIGIGLISHNPKILDYLTPDLVIYLEKGQIRHKGNADLANELLKSDFVLNSSK